MSDLVNGWSCDERGRDGKSCRNSHGCHCKTITAQIETSATQAARIEALEAALKPFAELKPVAWSLDADMFYIATNDIRHAASLLEKP